ncbi:unnamed protein product [Calypogeia fissa]
MEVFARVEMFSDAGPLFFEEFFSGSGEDFMEVGNEDNVQKTYDSAQVVLGEGISNALEDMECAGTTRPVSQLQDVPLAGDTSPGKLNAESDFLAQKMDNGGTARPVSQLQEEGAAGQTIIANTSVPDLDPHSAVGIEDVEDGGTARPVS